MKPPCGNGYVEFCAPFLGPELRCLQQREITAFLKYDACAGKPDGTPCKSAYLETVYTGAAALYEENGKCSGQYCFGPGVVVCEGKQVGQGCDFEGALNQKTYRFSGTCQKKYSRYAATCNITSQAYLGPATPIKSHPGRDFTGAPAPVPAPTTAPAPVMTTAPVATTALPASTKPATTTPSTTELPTSKPTAERANSPPSSASNQEAVQTPPPMYTLAPAVGPRATLAPLPTLSSSASAASLSTALPPIAIALYAIFTQF
ncbi:hypothetical protein P43SY_006829 [Pythium insidiosum]|uniref:Uncharacterized protein n=1 Tax=Pythium insidiosum TaxID=114742 RepID=A0AAD5Q584_PYTIN|nr:hypothetical protein P43SY_006829 [Pythium insidiosum]